MLSSATQTPPLLQVVSDEVLASVLNVADVSDQIDQAFTALAHGRAAIKARQRIDCGAVKLSSMGAIWLDVGLVAEKVYPTVNGQFGFVLNLFDAATGRPLAVMPGQAITQFRTPALTTLAIQHATRHHRSPRKMALFGAGAQGKAHAQALLQALPLQEVAVVDLADSSAWCQHMSHQHGVDVHPSPADQAVKGADVVVTVTRSKAPVFDGAWLSPGATVAAVGTSLPTGTELDDVTLRSAHRMVVEWKPQSLVEAGEVVLGLQSGALSLDRVVDWSDIVNGHSAWRQHEDEIVVFKTVGVGLTDLAAAALAWQRLQAQGHSHV